MVETPIVALTPAQLTPSVIPTNLQASTESTTTLSGVLLDETKSVPERGFSFKTVRDFKTSTTPLGVVMSSKEEKIILSLTGTSNPKGLPLDVMLTVYLNSFGITQTANSKAYSITVNGVEGLAIDIHDFKVFGEIATGQAVALAPNKSQVFVANAFAADGIAKDRWETKGKVIFEAVLDSVVFSELSP